MGPLNIDGGDGDEIKASGRVEGKALGLWFFGGERWLPSSR